MAPVLPEAARCEDLGGEELANKLLERRRRISADLLQKQQQRTKTPSRTLTEMHSSKALEDTKAEMPVLLSNVQPKSAEVPSSLWTFKPFSAKLTMADDMALRQKMETIRSRLEATVVQSPDPGAHDEQDQEVSPGSSSSCSWQAQARSSSSNPTSSPSSSVTTSSFSPPPPPGEGEQPGGPFPIDGALPLGGPAASILLDGEARDSSVFVTEAKYKEVEAKADSEQGASDCEREAEEEEAEVANSITDLEAEISLTSWTLGYEQDCSLTFSRPAVVEDSEVQEAMDRGDLGSEVEDKVRMRAYFLWLDGSNDGSTNYFEALRTELGLVKAAAEQQEVC